MVSWASKRARARKALRVCFKAENGDVLIGSKWGKPPSDHPWFMDSAPWHRVIRCAGMKLKKYGVKLKPPNDGVQDANNTHNITLSETVTMFAGRMTK